MKNFIIVGTPRSGTTFLCETLNKFENIWIPEFPNYEPFNPHNLKRLTEITKQNGFDQDKIIQRFINYKEQNNIEYFGFKTFLGFHSELKSLIKSNDLDVIILLRKNIWKVVGSMLIAIDHNDYVGSSRKHQPFRFVESTREVRRIMTFFNQLCRSYWELENTFSKDLKLIDKIYFEDILKDQSITAINEYFNQNITFDFNYNDDIDVESYIENFDEFKDFVKKELNKYKAHYSSLPPYIQECFYS